MIVAQKMYYRLSPEFTIENNMDESKNGYQYYLFSQTDIHPRWYDINLYYHQHNTIIGILRLSISLKNQLNILSMSFTIIKMVMIRQLHMIGL